MRTAEEIFQSVKADNLTVHATIVKAINEARKEAIKECAKRIKVTDPYQEAMQIRLRGNNLENYIQNNPPKIDKESILKLIDELH